MIQFSDRLANLSGNAIREIFKVLDNPEIISFAGGNPARECLPDKEITEIFNKLATTGKLGDTLQYGPTDGYMPFRRSCVKMLERVGITGAKGEDILAVSGGQQGIDLTYKAFINKGDCILVENPTYLASLHIAKTYEAKLVGVDADADGLKLDDLEAKIKEHNPKVLYLVPTFSNPTGKTISVEKRIAIAEMTAKYGVILLEDDPYSQIRFEGEKVPAIKSFDKVGNVIYVSSFSKTVAPGLRTGFVYASPEILRKFNVGKQATDVHTNLVSQAIISEYIESGALWRHIDEIIPVYGAKKAAMLDAIRRYMPSEMSYTNPEGGLFIWCEMPDYINTVELFSDVCALKCAYVPGTSFFADGSGLNTLRLNFSNASPEQIDTGIKAMGGFFRSLIK